MYEKRIQEMEHLIGEQDEWRSRCINLIASENVMSRRARSQAGSDFAHRYAEGHPGERYYRGTRFIDEIESNLKSNLKILFHCNHTEVRPISGTNANEAVFSRFLKQGDIVLENSKTLAQALDRHGFDVEAKEFGYTESHQVAVSMERFNGGEKASINLEMSDIILNMNLLPHEPLKHHAHPKGIRIGVQEMTRFGMGKDEMERIAELIKEVIMDQKDVKEEVHRFRMGYQDVKYSYDDRAVGSDQAVLRAAK